MTTSQDKLAKRQSGRPKGSKATLPTISPDDLLARYRSGQNGYEIAKHYGVTHQALYAYLLRHREKDWQSEQVARSLADYEKAKTEYETIRRQAKQINDQKDADRARIALACAQAQVKAAQWDLEKLCRRLFGQDAPPSTGSGLVINIGIHRSDTDQSQVIDITGESADK